LPTPQPFKLHVPESDIGDLHARLAKTRFPDQAPDAPWAYGTDLGYVRNLVDHWRTKFDWRAWEARLNAFPQFKVPLHGIDVHYLQVPGVGPDPKPLLLLHGWPGSVFEFLEIIPRLTDPARFGGDAADAFTVIAPSLPGYGLSFRPNQKRFSISQIADCFADLMVNVLGYKKFAAQGGDWGAFTCSNLGVRHADKLAGIHLNMLALRPDQPLPPNPTPEELRYAEEIKVWAKEETGYIQIQGTRPQTLAYGLTDSPAGLAAWITEKSMSGPITWAISKPPSPGITCWPTSRCTGLPVRSAHRSGPTMIVCMALGRYPPTAPLTCQQDMRPSPKRSAVRRAQSPRQPTPIFDSGPSCRKVAISPPWNNQTP
jgi:pimeloyl-ACP methyl ester carboxylesterase